MKARIEIPDEKLWALDTGTLETMVGIRRPQRLLTTVGEVETFTGLLMSVTVGAVTDFERNSTTITLDGPAHAVRPVVTYLMDFLNGV